MKIVRLKSYCAVRNAPSGMFRFLSWLLYCLLVALLLGFALTRAIMATHECLCPIGWDVWRDIGMGQVMLEGRYPEDPILLNETLWYNPLTGAMLALGNMVTGISMPRLAVLLGPWVNLAAPLGMVVLVACLFGRAAGLASLCMALFGKSAFPSSWVYFWYSPWLYPTLYGAGIMFFLFVVYQKSLARLSYAGHVLTGLLLGVVFMVHTAPAVVAGGTMLLCSAWEAVYRITGRFGSRKESDRERTAGGKGALKITIAFLLMITVAFFASLPYTWSILWNYQFQVRNPSPSLFALDYVLLEQLPARVTEALNWRNAFAVLGLLTLLYRRDRSARFVLCWVAAVGLLLTHHYILQGLERHFGTIVPGIVPGHHWSIHLTAVRAVLFAVGVVTAGVIVTTCFHKLFFMVRRISPAPGLSPVARRATGFIAACAAGFFLYAANPLISHPDLQKPDTAQYHRLHQRGVPAYEWILKNTPPDAVFICHEDEIAVTVVMPAARKLLFPPYIYCNPFVDPGPLSYVDRILKEPAMQGDAQAFCVECNKYSAVYMILREEELAGPAKPFETLFTEVFRAEGLVVFKARPCY